MRGVASIERSVTGWVMSFLVYFFVLLVAAGSVIFGLDWTQAPLNPPPYATLPAAATRVARTTPPQPAIVQAPVRSAGTQTAPATTASVATAGNAATAMASATHDEAAPASATATTATAMAGHCNIEACSSAFRSFRASDCTYQPYDGERRACTKTGVTGKIASASRSHVVRRSEPRDFTRSADRRAYDDDRSGGWSFDLFGGDR